MNFDYLNSIPDAEWDRGADGYLRKTFVIVELCRSLGIDVTPEWGEKLDFLGDAQPRRYRHGPSPNPAHTELKCLPQDMQNGW